jgi:hypothetical protein
MAQCAWRLKGWLAGVEPRARTGGSLTTRSSPIRSMENRGSHQGLRRRPRDRARAGNEEADANRDWKVKGVLVPLLEFRFLSQWWIIFLNDQSGWARHCEDGNNEWMEHELSKMWKRSGVTGEVQFKGARTGMDMRCGAGQGGGSGWPSSSMESIV